MDCSEAGRKGGSSRSARKRAASARNLEAARELRRMIPEIKAHVEGMKEEKDVTDAAQGA